MSVKTASELVSRAMRAAIRETISPANQGSRKGQTRHVSKTTGRFGNTGDVSRKVGPEHHQRLNTYIGSVNEFGCPGNIVDDWRLQFSLDESELDAANRGTGSPRKTNQG